MCTRRGLGMEFSRPTLSAKYLLPSISYNGFANCGQDAHKRINQSIRLYSSNITQHRELQQPIYTLNPWWVSGFVDGEASFSVLTRSDSRRKIGWSVEFCFQIDLHKKDQATLEQIKNYFAPRPRHPATQVTVPESGGQRV